VNKGRNSDKIRNQNTANTYKMVVVFFLVFKPSVDSFDENVFKDLY